MLSPRILRGYCWFDAFGVSRSKKFCHGNLKWFGRHLENIITDSTLTFAKSILFEYAARMNLENPSYQTIQLNMSLPIFISSLVFKGVTYTGDIAKSKKEAEQLAAHGVI